MIESCCSVFVLNSFIALIATNNNALLLKLMALINDMVEKILPLPVKTRYADTGKDKTVICQAG